MSKGIFIALEGPEGSGKSTQARLLRGVLKKKGLRVVLTREPGGVPLAEDVRRILLDPGRRVDPLAELFLYEAARAQHVADVIRPALARGGIVVCDRFTAATEAYQGHGRGLSLPVVRRLNRLASGGLRPDLTFFLDAPIGEGLARARGRRLHRGGDRLEREGAAFHGRVRRGYRDILRREAGRFHLIRWRKGPEKVHADILRVLKARFKNVL
ncbi:MAG: dTMP kinase [Elusimicrobiota bacterium]